jgi:hypothetical protein
LLSIGYLQGYYPVPQSLTDRSVGGHSIRILGDYSSDTDIVLDEAKQEGKDVREQITMILAGPAYFTFKWERSVEGGPWTVTSEGTMTKVK